MDRRLSTITSQIENGIGLADVGTDHGFLPVHLARHGYTGNLYASDINEGPLRTAVDNAEHAGVSGRIKFLLCDGLRLCPPDDLDTIVIAGMGGDMICRILDEAEWCMSGKYKLILQPMTKQDILRYWLVNNGFEICRELIAEDAGALYQVITARFGGETRLTDGELFTGKYELAEDKTLYVRLLREQHRRFDKAVHEMSSGDKCPKYKLRLFEELLGQLTEMRDRYDADK